jgi:hypothetical protein
MADIMAGKTTPQAINATLALGLCCVAAAGCNSSNTVSMSPPSQEEKSMMNLTIRWQRLVDDTGRTCERCGATEEAVGEAYELLKQSLSPLGFRVELQKESLDVATFNKNPNESNRIWIGDQPIEELLGAKVGQSPCCSACGDHNCRMLMVDGHTFEAIPSPLIVRAGLVAAARKVQTPSCCMSCCEGKETTKSAASASAPCCDTGGAAGKK